ncbi:MAG: DNA-deoxyinosine glycosylase [Proteobacteria bacterium]|nr:DNA-deoxyinosine glycosylase [Pseudomonadota bacterium]
MPCGIRHAVPGNWLLLCVIHYIMIVRHPIEPLFDSNSRVLVLGSFPSVRSREQGFFYGHPQNRFWKLVSGLFDEPFPETVPEQKSLILRHHLALWDVIASCEIEGSSDSSIRSVIPNDLGRILEHAPIERIYLNGKTAEKYYRKYAQPVVLRAAEVLPSTSPANAAWSLARLCEAWRVILP